MLRLARPHAVREVLAEQNSAGDCSSRSIIETRTREAVFAPLERLVGRMSGEKMKKLVRAELLTQQAAIEQAANADRVALDVKLARIDERLTRLEDLA